MKKFALVIGAMSLVATAAPAQVLDFEGITVGHPFGPVRFGSAPVVTPERNSLQLATAGLLGLAAFARRRQPD